MAAAAPFLSLALGAMQFFQGMSAADEQKSMAEEARRIDEKNSVLAERENMERERRAKAENEREEATSRARAAASGADPHTGSLALYQDTLETENERELSWLTEAGRSQVDIGRDEAGLRYRSGVEESKQTRWDAIGGLGKSVVGFGDSYDWWQGP